PIPPLNRDAISPPSAASGGIPNPTPAYLAQAYLSPQRTSQPQPLLVIIDLNGTLLHRPSPRAPSTFIERPRAGEFLRECLDAFYVVIWSSARPDNVGKMVRQLLPEPAQRARVLATWGRDRFGLSAADYYQRTQCYKRLTKVWTDPGVAAAHPLAGGRWGQANTVLIDDSIEKARSEPFNAVTIPEFTGRKGTDEVLALVHEYLCVLSMQADVSAFVRTHPF
ncbi:HAD-like domain-containing protein, partial [Schizothecium vesticola]